MEQDHIRLETMDDKLDHIIDKINDIKTDVSEHKNFFQSRLDRFDNKLWGLVILMLTMALSAAGALYMLAQ